MAKSKVIVVGGGLAGLMAAIKAAEVGTEVELFSLVPVKRSHSVCAQGGINGAVNTKGELAKKVLQVAKENDIKIVQNEDLVNFLSVQEIGSCIPEQVWSTVAKIFAYVIKNT